MATIISPDKYASLLQEGYTDEQLAPELALRAGKDINKLRAAGITDGQLARYFSGIDETDYQHAQNPVPERGMASTVVSQLARGVGDTAKMWGNAMQTADPDGGLNIGDAVGGALLKLEAYARANLGLMRPDESEGTDDIVTRGVEGGIRALPLGISTMLPALLLAPFTGGGSVAAGVAGLSGAAIFGYGTYGQAVKDMQNAKPEATKKEIHEYALKQALIEGGLEGASNVLTMGILKLGKISGLSPAKSIKQILKTPKKQLAKMWGLETLQETGTEVTQGALGAAVDQQAGMGDMSPTTGAVESIIPAVVMSSIFWTGSSVLNRQKKMNLLRQLNNEDPKQRANAAKVVSDLLKSETETEELSTPWLEMTKDRIDKGEKIDIHQDIVSFDPTAKEQDKQDLAEAAVEPVQSGGISQVTEVDGEVVDDEGVEPLGAVQAGDLLPYRKKGQPKNKPYIDEKRAAGAIKTRKLPEGKTVEDFAPVKVKGGWVIREVSKTEPKTKLEKPKNLDTEVIIKKSGFTTKEYEALTTEQQEQVKQEVQTNLVKEQLPAVDAALNETKESAAETKSAAELFEEKPTVETTAKVVYVPYKPAGKSEKVMAPMDPAKGTREEHNLPVAQARANEQTQEAILEDNDFKPWPVTYTSGKKGKKLSANFSWINQKAIDAIPKEDQPKSGIQAVTLKALEAKGFIKRAVWTDGVERWVPADWSAPMEAKTETRKTEPLVKVKFKAENSNKIIEAEVPITEALTDVNSQLDTLEKILRCME